MGRSHLYRDLAGEELPTMADYIDKKNKMKDSVAKKPEVPIQFLVNKMMGIKGIRTVSDKKKEVAEKMVKPGALQAVVNSLMKK